MRDSYFFSGLGIVLGTWMHVIPTCELVVLGPFYRWINRPREVKWFVTSQLLFVRELGFGPKAYLVPNLVFFPLCGTQSHTVKHCYTMLSALENTTHYDWKQERTIQWEVSVLMSSLECPLQFYNSVKHIARWRIQIVWLLKIFSHEEFHIF